MRQMTSLLTKAALGVLVVSACALVAAGRDGAIVGTFAPDSRPSSTPVVQSYFNPGFGFFGYASPFISLPTLPPPYPYMPKYWWTGSYPTADPRQSGYNPSAGYRWEDVTTLILGTSPKTASVMLDGNAIGSSEDLGPIQLPFGEHTLRVEAPGYEPSETVMRVETPSLQRVQVNLKRGESTPAPRP